mgnify:FL=1
MDDSGMEYVKKSIEVLEKRVSSHGSELDELKLSREHDSVMLTQIQATCNATRADLAKLNERVDSRAQEGAKRWDTVVNTLINGTVAALLAYIVWQLGLHPF